MGPQVALLVAALAGCLLPAGGCVICDQRVVAALDALDKEYLPTHMARERQGQVMETIRQTVRNFWDLPYLEDAFMGVIDDTFVKEFSWMLTLEKAAFQRNVAQFQREDCVLPQRIIEETPTSNFETEEQLSPTLQPSEYPKPEKVLRSVLVGLLIWGFVVLIISFVTA
ncbi:izumo sperm-egg fusion protein 1-like isoform X1 [Prionailurus iriomotensis]